ncbi:helix-turn-helix domain-containing protein [Celeribacter sp. SCSIO 80788]|uniref:helix-turn-helix domain-containing protein n=1 Tax=Celeribacter sp. SCSIO 80788 TaxID=3117013 RepID=UPI003DA2B1D1
MNAHIAMPGTSVVNMRAFDPEIVGSIFTRVDVSWPKDARAKFIVSSMGDLSLIRSKHRASNSKSRRLERHMTDGEDGQYFACMPLQGGVEIRHLNRNGNGHDCIVKSHHLTLLNTREEYEIAMSDELDAIWLRVPGKLLRAHAISVDDVLGKPLDIQSGLGCVAKQMMYGAVANNHHLKDRGARIFSQSLLSFLGEVINANLSAGQQTTSSGRRKILKRAQDFIDEHLHDEDLSPMQIAQGIGISARYLSEIFAAEGTSPMRWVRKRRLEMCRMELERKGGGQQLICEIAYSMGFTNVSSFNRAFKAHFGLSPRDLIARTSGASLRVN